MCEGGGQNMGDRVLSRPDRAMRELQRLYGVGDGGAD